MALMNGDWHCALCGAPLPGNAEQRPRPMVFGASGARSVRVLRVDGHEIHRCESHPAHHGAPRIRPRYV